MADNEHDAGRVLTLGRDEASTGDPTDETPTSPSEKGTSRGRSRVRKALLGLTACAVTLVLLVGCAGWYLQDKLSGQIDRIDGVFAGLTTRPTKPISGNASNAVNLLLLGTDRRASGQTTGADATEKEWVAGAQRTDSIMVLHIDGDRQGASLIAIPRDSWVNVPGYGEAKINAAFSFAGPALAVETVERVTNLRIDHLAVIDWTGFEKLTDALGGVTVNVPETVHDSARDITWTAGDHELDGKQALDYVAQRHGLPGGDFDRIDRQQNVLRGLVGETLSAGTLKNPKKVYGVLDALTDNLSVDSGWSVGDMRTLALSLRSLRSGDLRFTTVPVKGVGREGDRSVVYLQKSAGADLWGAVREDRVGDWLAEHPGAGLPASVR